MGLLDKSDITVAAILTFRGILSRGGNFNITKFALSDEEIDYTLYDYHHPNGTKHFNVMLENTSMLETNPNRKELSSYLIDESLSNIDIRLTELNYTNLNSPALINIQPVTIGLGGGEEYIFEIENMNILKFHPWDPVEQTNIVVVGNPIINASAMVRVQEINKAAATVVKVTGNTTGITKVISFQVNAHPDSNVGLVDNGINVTDIKF